MSLKRGTFFAEGSKNALVKEAELCEAGVLDRANVTFGKHEAIPVSPSGILGVDFHLFEIAGSNEICCRERSAGMSRICGKDFIDNVLTDDSRLLL
jgi:hypothetical protein